MPPQASPVDEFAPVKAVKAQVKLKVGISGPSNSGKTDGALAFATLFGSAADKNKKPRILLVDTENRSASLYADLYDFDTIHLKAPYTPERYKRAAIKAIEGGYDWLILDSISHEWDADGGILRQKDRLDLQANSNSYTNWAKLTPDHESFVEFIKQIPIHTICTMRSKQAYVLEADNRGKQKPRKVGMAPVQREGMEYEFTLVFDLDMLHAASVTKNRTRLFGTEPVDLRDPCVARDVRNWLEAGAVLEVQPEFKPVMESSQTAPQGNREPQRAVKPVLITNKQKQAFWIEARQSGKSDEDVRVWLYEALKLQTTGEIPAASFDEALTWAKKPLQVRQLAPGEAKARETAAGLGVGEADLQYELAQRTGDWEKLAEDLATSEVAAKLNESLTTQPSNVTTMPKK